MQTFIDAAGRSWSISLNLDSAIRVRDRLRINLLQAGIKIVENRIDKIDEAKQISAMTKRADAILGDLYGSSEADSVSTSEPSPSEN